MKPTVRVASITGDLGGRKIDMGIDKSAIQHIMSVLTDLYSDPAAAVVREYATNALDSHIEAGQTKPVRIEHPSNLNPYLTIQDFGLGLSVDEINMIYSQYGASTKRDSNDVAGMLGLGCKSGLTYAEQFIVIGIKDGIKTSVVVSRRENGTGVMEVVDTCSTDDPNGVTIKIPVSNVEQMRSRVDDFVYYWKPGTVTVDGKQPKSIWSDYKVRTINSWIKSYTQDGYGHNDYVVMGGVAYPIPARVLLPDSYYRSTTIVAFIDMGSVDITPSREALMMTDKTKREIARIEQSYRSEIIQAATNAINACQTGTEAYKVYHSWKPMLSVAGLGKMYWQGKEIPNSIDAKTIVPYNETFDAFSMRARGYYQSKIDDNTLVVYGYPLNGSPVSSDHRRKMRLKAKEIGLDGSKYDANIIVYKSKPSSVWIDGDLLVHDWADVKKIKPTAGPGGSGMSGLSGTRKVFVGWDTRGRTRRYHSRRIDSSIITQGTAVYYMSEDELLRQYRAVSLPKDNEWLVIVHPTHLDKFLRDFPNAIPYMDAREAMIGKFDDILTDNDKILEDYAGWPTPSICHYLRKQVDKIDDPDVVRFVNLIGEENKESVKRRQEYKDKIKAWGFDMPSWHTENPLDNYPLVEYSLSREHTEDMIIYINAKYANREEK